MHRLCWLAAVVLTACAACGVTTHLQGKTCDPSGRRGGTSQADYVHFIRHDGALYVAPQPQEGAEPTVGAQLGSIVCTLSGSATPWDYNSSREGEAGFVAEGTPYYAIVGCPERAAIAATWQGRRLVFVREPAAPQGPPVLADVPESCRS